MTDTVVGEAARIEATVRSAATGDEVAFARLVAEHHASMARVAYVVCGDAEASRDAVQSAWAIAWRRMGSLRDPTQVRAWLVAIAANEARQVMRRRRRDRVVDISDDVELAGGRDPVDGIELARGEGSSSSWWSSRMARWSASAGDNMAWQVSSLGGRQVTTASACDRRCATFRAG